jgi:glycosyltransferase involved in cell wall biosynthesis
MEFLRAYFMQEHNKLKVSIIVISKNEEKIIRLCLESIFKQTYPNIELIIVDSSTDNTPNIIKSLIHLSPFPVKLIFKEAKGCGFARNIGLNEATGDIITYIDADEIIPPDYVENIVREFNDPKCLGVWTKGTVIKPSKLISQVFWLYEEVYHPGRPAIEDGKCLDATVFRTSFLKSLGGYDVTLKVGEYMDLWRRIRKEIAKLSKQGYYFKCLDNVEFKHIRDDDFNFMGYFLKMIWYGEGRLMLYKKKLISFKSLLIPVYLALVPLLALVSTVYHYCWILLLPYLALFPFSIIKTFNEGFRDIKSLLISLLFPFIVIFKSFGTVIGMIKSLMR